jgi:hypothetical protein
MMAGEVVAADLHRRRDSMHWPRLAFAAVLAVTLTGCDSLPFVGGDDEAAGTEDQAAQAMEGDTGQAAETVESVSPPAAQPEPAAAAPTRVMATPAADEPWEPVRTGTVDPGMSREEVVGVWGEPVTERVSDGRAYLFYRNGCEVTCGTFDVVFLEGGQVVDAIVRGRGHTYSGTSSSPAGSEAVPTPRGAQART